MYNISLFSKELFNDIYIYIYVFLTLFVLMNFIHKQCMWLFTSCCCVVTWVVIIKARYPTMRDTTDHINRAPSQYKDVFSRYADFNYKIRRSWHRLIFIMGKSVLVRRHLYIKTGRRVLLGTSMPCIRNDFQHNLRQYKRMECFPYNYVKTSS